MARLLIHVEGETEEAFVNEVLAHHLLGYGYEKVAARLIGNARLRQRRGGIRPWASVKPDIIHHLLEDKSSIVTTMVDYYGLPGTGIKAWPGRNKAASLSFAKKASCVETAMKKDLLSSMDGNFRADRFIPFVMMHEFEGLLFSDCDAFGRAIECVDVIDKLQLIRDDFSSPEEINDSPLTAPSKRILTLVPHYNKPLLGTMAVLEIGLSKIREECPHFDQWITNLESVTKL